MPQEPRRKRVRPGVPYGGQIDTSGAPDTTARARSRPGLLLLVFIVLAAMGWFLIQNLSRASKDQDCMMAGRKNCAPIDTSALSPSK